ncbi:SDR family NAD(P)-dependent oxidoreductase [Paractinoplanes globisporus]|uniref:SDR family NAD(P)-dependent oxidoreductase n=1 Tax=Paractinoplanes globisporus TaxID=113565 RepID=A0ABW6WBN1_9ACTN|nr:SDR family NAD(P)-dependent oxidoreductase [Actinoplanes globisporus]
MTRTIVISGGTDGMGRAMALARSRRGDEVITLGSNPDKGRDVPHFHRVDLSDVDDTRRVIEAINERWPNVDALLLFANRQAPRRVETKQGLEQTFALYYLSRYLLGKGLRPRLTVNVAGVGVTKGTIHWDDLQLAHGYSMVKAQLQAGRCNDLLGVIQSPGYVLYHPGFTRSGDLTPLPKPLRLAIRIAAKLKGQPIEQAIHPIHDWIDHPPDEPLLAVDRGRKLPLDLPTLRPADARKLAEKTEQLLTSAGTARSR